MRGDRRLQALQHRLADLHVLVESARSLSQYTPPPPGMRRRGLRAAAAKVYCSEVLMRQRPEMIQLHGAIGITWNIRRIATSSGRTAGCTCSVPRRSTPPASGEDRRRRPLMPTVFLLV